MEITCPNCQKLNTLEKLDNYSVDADACRCYYCNKTFWLEQDYFSDALDEAIIVVGKPAKVKVETKEYDIYLKKASKEDFEDIYRLYLKVNEDNSLDKEVNYSRPELETYLSKINVAKVGSNLVGFFLLFDIGIWGYLDIFCVSPMFRRGGVGSRMVEEIDRIAQDKSWRLINTLIEPQNFKTATFFENKNFTCFGSMLYQSKLYKEKY